MTYRLDNAVYLENGPAVQLANLRATHSTARNWGLLDESDRLDLIERALRPANDLIDAYPLAL